jgi:hypothetical protein
VEFVLLIFAGIIIYAFVKAKSRMHYASMQHARRNLIEATEAQDPTLPTWVNNKDRMDEFVYAIVNLARRKSVSRFFVEGAVRDPGTLKMLLTHAGLMERERSGFVAQQAATAELVIDLWNRLGQEKQEKFREVDVQKGW